MTKTTDIEALHRQIAELQAQLAAAQQASVSGSGAVAQGTDATAAGAGAVVITGDSTAPINTGMQIAKQGHFIGRDFIQIISQITRQGEDLAKAQSIIAHYLQALAADLAGLKLGEIDGAAIQLDREPLQLADVYVPLDTRTQIPTDSAQGHWKKRQLERDHDAPHTPRETRSVSALEALAKHRVLTVLGNAGSGKSTFGASVLLALAQTWLGHTRELTRLGKSWTHGALLPIRVVLSHFAKQLPAGDAKARAGDLWAFIAEGLRNCGVGLSNDTMRYIQDIARDHGALILLDGLDECGNQVTRKRVLSAVAEIKRTAGTRCRFLVTARPYAWSDGENPAQGVYALAELNNHQVQQFIGTWYDALVRRRWLSSSEAQRKKDDLLSVWKRADLQPLARNPLLLTLMTTLHANHGQLPDDRADLYEESVDLLLLRWNRQIGADQALLDALAMPGLKLSDLRAVLEKLAFDVHQCNFGAGGTADIGEDRLVRAFCPLLNHSKDKADLVVDYIEKRAGLLIGQGEKHGERQFAFPHRSFQEFLAACHLAAKEDFATECVRLALAAPGHWELVLPLAARLAKPERGASAADALVHGCSVAKFRGPTAADWIRARLAGQQLLEIGLSAIHTNERTRRIADRVVGWLVASLPLHPNDGGAPAIERAQAGDVLAKLGDPRFDPQRHYLPADDMLGFVHIPADPEFVMGTRAEAVDRVAAVIGANVSGQERNDICTPTAAFYIARFPITVAQFRAFVESTPLQLGHANVLRDANNHPVRWVSWYAALAYCDWLNHRLAAAEFDGCELASRVREGGWQITLPSELEWEQAARGGLRDAVFAWGDRCDSEHANGAETAIGATSTVGCFPANGYGLHDVIGNVWEWTRSQILDYSYRAEDGREHLDATKHRPRSLRGGSWDDRHDVVRCAYRYWFHPSYRGLDVGFRVVLRASGALQL